jgi:hypothetical protein
MLKRLSAALLFGGLLLGLAPTAAEAAPSRPAGVTGFGSQRTQAYYAPYDHRDDRYRDDHYRCMYHCDGYDRGRQDRYGRDRYGRDRNSRDRYGRVYHGGDCWYHDDWGWHRCRSGSRDRDSGGGSYSRDYGGNDSAHASGGYDSHREH